MTICDMHAGERAVVLSVELDGVTRERLRYLNLSKGSSFTLLKTFCKRTYFLQARSAKFAIGSEVAQKISVGSVPS